MVNKNIYRIQTSKNVPNIKKNIYNKNYKIIGTEKQGKYTYLYFDTKGKRPSQEFYDENKKLANGNDLYLTRTIYKPESQDAQELNKYFGVKE